VTAAAAVSGRSTARLPRWPSGSSRPPDDPDSCPGRQHASRTQVISGRASGIGSVWLFFRNSLAVTLVTVLLASLLSLLASVAVARFRFRTSLLIVLLIVQMIPGQALIIALFVDFNRLGLLQNLGGLVIVYAAQALPVSIWMLRNFVATVPRELEEAAAIDGASSVVIFWRILFPLVAPGLVATSIFAFITARPAGGAGRCGRRRDGPARLAAADGHDHGGGADGGRACRRGADRSQYPDQPLRTGGPMALAARTTRASPKNVRPDGAGCPPIDVSTGDADTAPSACRSPASCCLPA